MRTPETILDTHERLRTNGFPVVSVLSGRRVSDSRVFFGAWTGARNLRCVIAPEICPNSARRTYVLRNAGSAGQRHPLLFVGTMSRCMEAALAITANQPDLPIAIATSTDNVLADLLDPTTPLQVVNAALQGLVAIEPVEDRILTTVTESRRLGPLLRSSYEGLIYYLLESRRQTRGRFLTNQRISKPCGLGSYEADLVANAERVVVEIDGAQHRAQKQTGRDEIKQRDLELLGYRVMRFSAAEVSNDPVGVWTLLLELLEKRTHQGEGTHGAVVQA